MSRYFVVANTSYAVFEQARAAARSAADATGNPCTVEVYTDGRLTKVYTYQAQPAAPAQPVAPAPDAPDALAALTARVEQLEAALAELISAQAKPRTRRTKAA